MALSTSPRFSHHADARVAIVSARPGSLRRSSDSSASRNRFWKRYVRGSRVRDGDEEEIRLRELFQLGRRPRTVQRRVAERAAEPVEDRRADEELLVLRGQVVEVLEADVVADEAVRAAEGGDRLVVRARELGEPGQVDACGPALRAVGGLGDLGVRHGQARAPEEPADLLLGQPELVDPEADDSRHGAQVVERKRGLGAAREDDPRRRRQVAHDLADDREAVLAVEQVQVVDEQRERPGRLDRALEPGSPSSSASAAASPAPRRAAGRTRRSDAARARGTSAA